MTTTPVDIVEYIGVQKSLFLQADLDFISVRISVVKPFFITRLIFYKS